MIVLDTTVLVYAVGAAHDLREPCHRMIRAIGNGRLAATTTTEVIQEFTHIRARRRGRDDAVRVAASFVDLLSPLICPDGDDLRAGLDLFATNENLGSFDAVLLATARRHDHVDAIVSADRAFGAVTGIAHVDPSDRGAVDRLVGAT